MLIVWSGWWWLRKTWVMASGATPRRGQRIEDQAAPGDHPRVDDDQRVAVADEDDAAADAVAGIAGVEEVDGGHRRMLRGAPLARASVATDGMRPRSRADARRRRHGRMTMSISAPHVGVAPDPAERCSSCATELIRGSGKEIDPVNAVAVMYVNSHLADLRAEAQRNRVASLAERRSLRERLSSGTASLRRSSESDSGPWSRSSRTIPTGADPPPSALPRRHDDLRLLRTGVFVCPASAQVGGRVDVADGHAVGIEGAPRRLRDDAWSPVSRRAHGVGARHRRGGRRRPRGPGRDAGRSAADGLCPRVRGRPPRRRARRAPPASSR